MIMEPAYTINTLKYRANRHLASKEGYQWYDIDFKNKQLSPMEGGKLIAKAPLVESILKDRMNDKTVIDIGCDKGYFSWLACKCGASRVVSVDINHKVVEYLERLAHVMKLPIEVMNHDLFKSNAQFIRKFDYALLFAVLHQIKAAPKSIMERLLFLADNAIIEFCDDYASEKGPEWTIGNFEAIVNQYYPVVEFVGKHQVAGGWRYLYDCRCN